MAQVFRGLDDRGLGRTGPPAEQRAGPVVVDHEVGQRIAGCLLGGEPRTQGAEVGACRVSASWRKLMVGPSANTRMRSPAAPGVAMANRWASARSRTSTTPKRWRGATGRRPVTMAWTSLREDTTWSDKAGPSTKVGLTTTSSVSPLPRHEVPGGAFGDGLDRG